MGSSCTSYYAEVCLQSKENNCFHEALTAQRFFDIPLQRIIDTISRIFASSIGWYEENNLVPLKVRSFSDNLIANLKKYNLEHTNNIVNAAGRRVWGYLGIEALVRPESAFPSWER